MAYRSAGEVVLTFLRGRSQHPTQHLGRMGRVPVGTILGQQSGRLGAILAGPQLRLDDGVDHLLRPLRALVEVSLVHKHHTAGMVTPDISREALYATDLVVLR
ncbi:hypothetical protein D9M68_706820 [compost metagenome]